jgi:hypothetical protein
MTRFLIGFGVGIALGMIFAPAKAVKRVIDLEKKRKNWLICHGRRLSKWLT